MKKKMRQAEQPSRVLRDQSMHWLIPIDEARPCHVRNCVWQRGPLSSAVKRVVTVPQDFPFGKIALLGCSYQDLIGQDDASFMCILVREPRALPDTVQVVADYLREKSDAIGDGPLGTLFNCDGS